MIISRGRNYIFVHSPKTGGTALSLALENRAMADDILIGDTPKAVKRRKRLKSLTPNGRLWKHSTLADIEGILTKDEIADMLVVTLVRNPWDRMVSYYHWLREQNFDHDAVARAKTLDFTDFILDPFIDASMRSSPFTSYVTTSDGVDHGDIFIRLEHLDRDVEAFEDHLGFSLEIPIANQSKREKGYQGYFTPATRDAVADYCAADIERFGYRFD